MNSRMYRGTWLLVGIPLLIAAFSVHRPDPLRAPLLEPDFDAATARLNADDFAGQFPNRVPGSPTAHLAARWVEDRLSQYGLSTESERFHAKIPGLGRVRLENLLAFRQGQSNELIVVVAHRDNTGTSPGANDNGSGTAALIELARSFATPRAPPRPPQPNHTILFLSTDGGAFGGLGAEHFANESPYRRRVIAVVNLTAIASRAPPRLAFAADTPKFPSATLVRTAGERVLEQTGSEPARPSAFAQLLDLGFPLSLYEQAPFVDRGIAAITLTSGGDRPPASSGDTPPLSRPAGRRLAEIGRAGQDLLGSLEEDVDLLGEGTASYVYLGERVVRGWAVALILVAALLPALAVIVDLFARLRRRHVPLAPALRSYRSRLAFWLSAGLLFELFAILGVWGEGPARPLVPEVSPGTEWPAVGLAVYACLLAGAWLVARDRLLPRRALGEGEELAGEVGALLVLAVLSLLVVALNPYSLLFVLPSLHAWIWIPHLRAGPSAVRAAVLAAGFGGPLLLVGSLAVRLDLGLDAPWYLGQLVAVGYIPLPALLVTCAWFAVAGQLTAAVAGRYAPYPTRAERPRLGPGRRLFRWAIVGARRRKGAAERDRAVGL